MQVYCIYNADCSISYYTYTKNSTVDPSFRNIIIYTLLRQPELDRNSGRILA